MRLADLFLRPVALGESAATPALLLASMRRAAGRAGRVETLTSAGDPAEPAEIVTVFGTPGGAPARATILFVHGKGGFGAEWWRDAARALRLGYNVLVPDLRAHPPSTGARITYGLRERNDLSLLLDAAAGRFGIDVARVGVDSCSMGSLVALQLAAQRVPPLAALWLQSPFGDLRAMAVQYAHRATALPTWLLRLPTSLAISRIEHDSGLDLSSADPVAAAARVRCPVTVIHGEDDLLVPFRFAPPVFEALAGEKELWRAPRCGHCHHPDEPQAIRGAEYLRRWAAFFARHLPVARPRGGKRARLDLSSGA